MPALAITDHGNMFGVFQFVAEAYKHRSDPGDKNSPLKVKPIVGCEFYITDNRHRKTFSKEEKDPRHHQILLAKNEKGYQNLIKLTSLGYIEGMYSKYPRIDKELIHRYHEGLIATTCCLGAYYFDSIETDEFVMPAMFEVEIRLADNQIKIVTVEVEKQSKLKPYIGGFRNNKTGQAYHHAFS